MSLLLAVAFVAAALLLGSEGGPATGDPVRVAHDLRYAGPAGPRMDVYRPPDDAYRPAARAGRRPAVLVVHGGSWRAGAKGDVEPTARALAEAGFVAFAPGYTLAAPGRAGYPRQRRELRAAVRYVRRNANRFGVDSERIGGLGISAGAHLVALVATAARGPLDAGGRLGAYVSWSGPLELRAAPLNRVLGAEVANFLGCWGCPRRAAAASPTAHVSRDDPPAMIVNSSEELVPAEQARRMARRLRAAGVPVRLLIVPGSLHAPLFEADVIGPSIAFLRRQLR